MSLSGREDGLKISLARGDQHFPALRTASLILITLTSLEAYIQVVRKVQKYFLFGWNSVMLR